jgi:hypothetical protein
LVKTRLPGGANGAGLPPAPLFTVYRSCSNAGAWFFSAGIVVGIERLNKLTPVNRYRRGLN